MTPLVTACLAVALALPSGAKTVADSSELDPILASVGQRFRGAVAVEGRFTQTYTNRVLKRTVTERGRLVLSPPDRVRWEYTDPEQKLFVTEGRFAWFYVPDDRVAYRLHLDAERARLLPTRFILGDVSLREEFKVRALESPEGRRRLELTPRVRADEFESLVLELSDPGSDVLGLTIVDGLGNVTNYEFSALQAIEAVSPGLFKFEPPEHVEVVGDTR